MDNRIDVREFLMTRRAKVTPQQAGLPVGPGRRVPGLRRSEVAMLAGVSVEYYAKLERGAIAGASASVLDAVATALQLDATERAHLFDLASAADGVPTDRRLRRRHGVETGPVRPGLQWTLDAQTDAVAFVRDRYRNVRAMNALARAFYAPLLATVPEGGVPNLLRFQFLEDGSEQLYPEWDRFAQMAVASLRVEVGRAPHDPVLQELVAELSEGSALFRRLWGAHDVLTHGAGTKHFRHPVVGDVTVAYEELAITAEPDLVMIVYTAEPASTSQERLRVLASWAASQPEAGAGAPAADPRTTGAAQEG